MPDIAMCLSTNCPDKTSCYRNKASGTIPNQFWQPYLVSNPEINKNECEFYWETNGEVYETNVR